MNAKMLLCAAVDGDESDYHEMREVNTCATVRCTCNPVQWYTVRMHKYGFDGQIAGYVGRCQNCLRIYYKEEK